MSTVSNAPPGGLAADTMPFAASRKVVIIGCGPAGLTAAAVLARAGCSVQVFEKREHPKKVSSEAEDRAYVVALNTRGRASLEQAGFDLEKFERPNSGVVHLSSHQRTTNGLFRQKTEAQPYTYRALLGDRMSWVRLMLEQVEGMGMPITFTFNAACEALDLQGRMVAIRQGEGPAQVVPFDLMVGADGAYNQVRTCLAKALPSGQLRVKVEPSPRLYKVIRGLPAEEFGNASQVRTIVAAGSSFKDRCFEGAIVMVVPRYDDGKRCGTLRMLGEAWEGLTTADDFAALLTTRFPQFPAACVPMMAKQLVEGKLHMAGARVAASQFHGPSVVLIGDAAHAVLPLTGNGMNSALEGAVLLGQLLESHGGDLAAVPPAFSAARKADADALGWLDRMVHTRVGSDGRWQPRCLLASFEHSVRGVLCTLTGGRVRPHNVLMLHETCMPFSQIKWRVQVEDAAVVAVAILGAAGAAAALWWLLTGWA